MKLRKTRIKKDTKANGAVVYTAEYKCLFGWIIFFDSMGREFEWHTYLEWRKTVSEDNGSLEQAKDLIDFYQRRVKHTLASSIENKVVKTEYEEYP